MVSTNMAAGRVDVDGCAMLLELCGMEFDWFAADSDGNLALFATAGEGFVPKSAAKHHAQHVALSDPLPTPRMGTPEVWKDYAALGLYVFDWNLPGGPYEKRESPIAEVSHELRARIMAIPALPTFVGSFSSLGKLGHWQ
jgi:hypothetical protein